MDNYSDVLIIGAGVAGASAAHCLAAKGVKVTLVDQRSQATPCFKAEKIEPDQADLFRKLNLLDIILPYTARINEIKIVYAGKLRESIPIEQYGVNYHDMVNALRAKLPHAINFICGKVVGLSTSKKIQTIELSDGTFLKAKLLILGCGIQGKLQEQLKMKRTRLQEKHSLVFGFNISPENEGNFSFDSVTYYPPKISTRVGFVSFFWIQNIMRANMFCYWDVKSKEMRSFMDNPDQELRKLFPKLEKILGKFKISSKVEVFPIDLDRAEQHIKDGVVLIGDAYQSVCPSTGTGLSKVLVDVDRLCNEYIPTWLKSSEIDETKIAQFYEDSIKCATDKHSLNSADILRQTAINSNLYWKYCRKRYLLGSVIRGFLAMLS